MKMRYFKKQLAVLTFGALLIGGTACVKDFGDTNINPGVTTTISTAGLLTNALSVVPAIASSTRDGLYTQYFSETQYTETSLYQEPKIEFGGTYSGALYDLQNIIVLNTGSQKGDFVQFGSNANQIAVARIVKAFIFWNLTDRYGDIPYSQALKGVTPAYDTQESIYKDLIKELTEAVAQFDGGAAAQGDILFKGNKDKWKKFANSLRLLMALRLSKADATYAAAQVAAVAAADGGLIMSNDDNAVIDFPGGSFNNLWYNLYNGRTDYAVSETMMDMLNSTDDNRINAFGTSDVGFPYGLKRDDAVVFGNNNPGFARILNADYRKNNSDITILSSAVVKLALAEAKQRGWISTGGTPAELYNDAIKDSWNEWGVFVQADYDTYINLGSIKFGTGDELNKIATQRWVCAFPNGSQGWFEWRRTGYPALTPTPNAIAGTGIPRRYVYGTNEYTLNEAGVKAAVARIPGGKDIQDARVWWDK